MTENEEKMGELAEEKREVRRESVKNFMDDIVYRIDLDAEYQREKIWPQDKQELLLNSIITDIDIPKIYLVETDNKQFDYECIDGKQRITTLIRFLKPEDEEKNPLEIEVLGRKYTYKKLKQKHPTIANFMDDYELDLSILKKGHETDIHEIFRRLQLGIPLNAGEILKSRTGNVRDFIFKEIGKDGRFFRNTKLSEKRFSRELTLSQILINSFSKSKNDEFVRARLADLENFFEKHGHLDFKDDNFNRIREVLEIMDKAFGSQAGEISSRAVAVSAYLFVEELYVTGNKKIIPQFVEFYLKLLNAIREEMTKLRKFEPPNNTVILDQFQKYILQASVESYSIKRRHKFLKTAFDYHNKHSNKIICDAEVTRLFAK